VGTRRTSPPLVPTVPVGTISSTLCVVSRLPTGRGASRPAFPRRAWEREEPRHPSFPRSPRERSLRRSASCHGSPQDAERQDRHSHAERGNEKKNRLFRIGLAGPPGEPPARRGTRKARRPAGRTPPCRPRGCPRANQAAPALPPVFCPKHPRDRAPWGRLLARKRLDSAHLRAKMGSKPALRPRIRPESITTTRS